MPGPERSGPERAGGAVGPSGAAIPLATALLVLAALLNTGCSHGTLARERPAAMGPSGHTWELVIESPEAGAIAFATETRPELTRRNASMNIADTSARLATDVWPEEPRPSLRNDRRIFLPRDEGTYLYFGTAREWERRTYRWRGGY